MDSSATLWVNAFAGCWPLLDSAMITVSAWGIPIVILFTVTKWWSMDDRPSARHACIAAALSLLAGLAVNQLILLFVHRVRPYDAGVTNLLIARSADWSFPSDHATAATAIVAALWLKEQRRFATLLAVIAIFIGVSRVFVGIHYASDVIGGAVIGIAAAVIVCKLFRETQWTNQALVRIL